jgi:hypothetical protein
LPTSTDNLATVWKARAILRSATLPDMTDVDAALKHTSFSIENVLILPSALILMAGKENSA